MLALVARLLFRWFYSGNIEKGFGQLIAVAKGRVLDEHSRQDRCEAIPSEMTARSEISKTFFSVFRQRWYHSYIHTCERNNEIPILTIMFVDDEAVKSGDG